jgi:glutaredoxin
MSWLRWFRERIGRTSTQAEPYQQVVIYTRAGCHLCDEAREVLQRHGLRPESVDIDSDPDLRSRYGDCVPVVLFDGREHFRGRVNEVLLRRLLRRQSAVGR